MCIYICSFYFYIKKAPSKYQVFSHTVYNHWNIFSFTYKISANTLNPMYNERNNSMLIPSQQSYLFCVLIIHYMLPLVNRLINIIYNFYHLFNIFDCFIIKLTHFFCQSCLGNTSCVLHFYV